MAHEGGHVAHEGGHVVGEGGHVVGEGRGTSGRALDTMMVMKTRSFNGGRMKYTYAAPVVVNDVIHPSTSSNLDLCTPEVLASVPRNSIVAKAGLDPLLIVVSLL